MKKTLACIVALSLAVISFTGISALATVEGYVGNVNLSESFDTDCENFYDAVSSDYNKWMVVSAIGSSMANTDLTGLDDEKVRVENGQLIIPKGARNEIGASYVFSGSGDRNFSFYSSYKKADECVFEFDASLPTGSKIYLNNAGTIFMTIRNVDGIRLLKYGGKIENNADTICLGKSDNEMHRYKVVLRGLCKDESENILTYQNGSYFTADGTPATVKFLYIMADVYVDGICYSMDESVACFTSGHTSRFITNLTFLSEINSGGMVVDNVNIYHLNNEKRTDATFAFKGDNEKVGKTYFAGDLAALNEAGNRLEVEFRGDGTQSENTGVKVFLVQYDANGKLKDVVIEESLIAAGSVEKSRVTINAPYFESGSIEAGDYMCAFVWSTDEKVPFADSRIITAE